jgi:hypothetical protein
MLIYSRPQLEERLPCIHSPQPCNSPHLYLPCLRARPYQSDSKDPVSSTIKPDVKVLLLAISPALVFAFAAQYSTQHSILLTQSRKFVEIIGVVSPSLHAGIFQAFQPISCSFNRALKVLYHHLLQNIEKQDRDILSAKFPALKPKINPVAIK